MEKKILVFGEQTDLIGYFKKYSVDIIAKNKSIEFLYVDINAELKDVINEADEYAILIHADAEKNGNGEYKEYKAKIKHKTRNVKDAFPTSKFYIISNFSGVKEDLATESVIKYEDLYDMLRDDTLKFNRRSIGTDTKRPPVGELSSDKTIDYLFITALYENEWEHLKLFCEFPTESEVQEHEVLLNFGTLKNNTSKKILAVWQPQTGMVDAAVLTAEMIARFNPKVVVMTGVCGGDPDTEKLNLEDIILPNKIFTFENGKIKGDIKNDVKKLNNLQDVQLKGGLLQKIKKEKSGILAKLKSHFVNDSSCPDWFNAGKLDIKINVPMACSTMVVDVDGFFEEVIKKIDRDTTGVDMESYAVARACHLAHSKPDYLIIKSVMDKTKFKDDTAKALAGKTSAKLLEELINMKII